MRRGSGSDRWARLRTNVEPTVHARPVIPPRAIAGQYAGPLADAYVRIRAMPPISAAERARRRTGWRLMGDALRPYLGRVAWAALAGLVWTAAKVSVPTLAAVAIDRGIVA